MSWLVRLDRAAAAAPIGGKARSLLRLAEAGLPVPPAVVATAELYRHLRAGGPPLPAAPDTEAALAAFARAAAALAAAPLPDGLEAALAAELAALAPGASARFAVRSSADVEDRAGALAAGLFVSRVGVAAGDVPGALRAVLASALSPAAAAYAARFGLDAGDLEMAVLIHPYTDGDAAGTAACEPAPAGSRGAADAPAATAPLVEVNAGRTDALRPAARAAIEGAARALAAAHGPVELEWVSDGDSVRFLQLRPYRAPRARPFAGDAELAALPGGPWRWDAAHNPLPLSPAQAGLVAFADDRCRTAFRQRVVRGYLFYAPAPAPAATPGAARAGTAAAALRTLAAAAQAGLATPDATLEQSLERFAAAYEPLFGEIQPAAAAARAALADLLRAHGLGTEALPALLGGVPSLASERAARAAAVARAGAGDAAARAAAVAAYLALFGDEAPVWDVAVPTYAEDPSAIERLAGAGTRAGTAVAGPTRGAEARAAAARVRASLPETARPAWDARLAAAQEAAAVAEDDDALYARVQAAVRRALLAEGERLHAAGLLARAADVFWLPLESVRRHARGEAPLSAREAARAVAEARAAHAEALADPPPLAPPRAAPPPSPAPASRAVSPPRPAARSAASASTPRRQPTVPTPS